ncbi:uncharacterized protein [Cherax quadricarinatus]|uniref:uncharacterized protein n=1 Tax=Cherax quadricarinatus TaxID=27406 RepID=UPI00387E692E
MVCEGYQIHFELLLETINNTLVPILRPIISPCPVDPWPIVAGSFLSLIFLIAFILNLMVVVTVCTSYTLKRFLYCHLLINLSLACMIDCFLNLSVSIGYVFTAPWRFGYGVSHFNSFTMNMMNSEMAFSVILLAFDRLAAAKKYTVYLNAEKSKLGVVIFTTWVVSFLMASPLVCGYIHSMPYRNRYSCSIADPYDDYYLIVPLVVVVCAPTIIMVVLVCITSVIFHRERKNQKRLKNNQTVGYFDQILMTPYFKNEFYPAVFANCTVILYLVFWLPFTALNIINPMITKHWANETTNDTSNKDFKVFSGWGATNFTMTKAMLDETTLRAINKTNTSASHISTDMSNITVDHSFIPEVTDTPVFDTVAVWFRYIFIVLVPILVFVILSEVRAKCEALIMCCRPNSVDVASPKPTRPYISRVPSTKTANKNGKSQKKQKSGKNTINFKTPILFSTSEGLHIRTVEDTYLNMKDNKPLLGFSRENNDNPKFVYSLCDVMLGYEELMDFDGQYHIDDNFDFEQEPVVINMAIGNAVVMGAQRAAVEKKIQLPEENEPVVNTAIEVEYRPPTPPKVPDEDSAENVSDAVDAEVANKQKKGKKVVRFATMLNEVIPPRPNSAESSPVNSSASTTRSNDSGIVADAERHSPQQADVNKKPTVAAKPNKPQVAPKHTERTPAKTTTSRRPAVTSSRKPAVTSKKPTPSPVKPPGVKTPKKAVPSNVRNIKSRHINVLPTSPTTPRRFSKLNSGDQHASAESHVSRYVPTC